VPPLGAERALGRLGEAAGAAFLLALLGVIVFSILARDLIAVPTPWLEEIATLLAVYGIAFASIGAWTRGAHIAVEILPMLLSAGRRAVLGILILLISLAFLLLAASGAHEMMQRSAFNRTTALAISFTWYYAGLLIAFGGMALMIILRLAALTMSAVRGRRGAP